MPGGAEPEGDGPLAAYRLRLAAHALVPDETQARVAARLDVLHAALRDYAPRRLPAEHGDFLSRLGFGRRGAASPPATPRGVYIHGGVGRGKSMLMDLFFAGAPIARKRRVHFNAFMLEVHARIHTWRQANPEAADPIPPLARAIADGAWLLCFDEFHVVDIADAMILGRLFVALFDLGVVVVATSNWAPDDLYADGLQRALFLPFIALFKRRLDVLALKGGRDYRRARLSGRPVYFHPLGPATDRALSALFADLSDNARPAPRTLAVPGSRTLEVPQAADAVARIGFDALCARPLGAADYLTLAGAFRVVIVDGVPRFTEARRNEMKRFIVLIDSLYEARRVVAIGAEATPERLYAADSQRVEFARTESRLLEMQSAAYLDGR
jgi:cell division protein ZapE